MFSSAVWLVLLVIGLVFLGLALYLWGYFTGKVVTAYGPCSCSCGNVRSLDSANRVYSY